MSVNAERDKRRYGDNNNESPRGQKKKKTTGTNARDEPNHKSREWNPRLSTYTIKPLPIIEGSGRVSGPYAVGKKYGLSG